MGAEWRRTYTKVKFAAGEARFDVTMDMVGDRPLSECRSVLTPTGTYLACSGGGGNWVGPMFRVLAGLISFAFTSRKFKMFVMSPKHEDLVFLTELVEAGKARPVIENSYPFSLLAKALRQVGEGHSRGQTVVSVVPGKR